MKRSNKILLLGFILISLALALYTYIGKYHKTNGTDVNLGTFKNVILNKNYKNTQFLNIDIGGIVEGNAKIGVVTDSDTVNKVIATLEDMNLKKHENENYDMNNFLTLTFSGSDDAYLKVGIVDNKVLLVQTNASSSETFSDGYVIVNNNIHIIEKLEEILRHYMK